LRCVWISWLCGWSDQSADDLVEGLGLAALLVEPSAAADQSTADDGTRPEGAGGPPVADRKPVHGGVDGHVRGGAAVVGQVVVGGGGDEGADDGDAKCRAELLGDVVDRARRTRVAWFDTQLRDRDRRDDGRPHTGPDQDQPGQYPCRV